MKPVKKEKKLNHTMYYNLIIICLYAGFETDQI